MKGRKRLHWVAVLAKLAAIGLISRSRRTDIAWVASLLRSQPLLARIAMRKGIGSLCNELRTVSDLLEILVAFSANDVHRDHFYSPCLNSWLATFLRVRQGHAVRMTEASSCIKSNLTLSVQRVTFTVDMRVRFTQSACTTKNKIATGFWRLTFDTTSNTMTKPKGGFENGCRENGK